MLRVSRVFAVVLCAATATIYAQDPKQEVTSAEEARVAAVNKGDGAAVGRYLSSDFVQVDRFGQLLDKAAIVKRMAPQASPFVLRESNVQPFGDTAVVTGITQAPDKSDFRFVHVWHRQEGRWVQTFVHNTPVKAPEPPPNGAAKGAPTTWPEGKTQDERDVLKVQKALNVAFAAKDADAYGNLTAANFVRVGPQGRLMSRAEFLKVVAGDGSPNRMESTNSDIRVRVYGQLAIVTCIDRGVMDGAIARLTRVYIKENGTWKQLVGQSTPIGKSTT